MKLLFKPVQFFEELKYKQISIMIPVIILIFVGLFDGVVNTLIAENQSLSDLWNQSFPISNFLLLLVSSNFSYYIILTLQTIFFHLIIIKLGGKGGSRKHAFYILGMAATPLLIQSIIHLIFPETVWWKMFDSSSIMYFISYSLLNLASIWSVALLVIGFAKVYDVSYKTASILYLQFLLKLVPVIIIMLLAN